MPVVAASALLVAALGSAAAAEAPPRAPEERVSVRRARVPVVLDDRRAGGCGRVAPGDVIVTLDGRPVEVAGVDRARVPSTLHALVLDTSPSMLRRLDEFRGAAREYVRDLPAGDAVLLASLDDRLVLHQAPTSDREALGRALDELRPGRGTALWLALEELLTYLESYPGRKVAAVVTDGCDHLLPDGPHPGSVVARAALARDLTVFPVATDAPVRCPGTPPVDPRMWFYPLGRATGGETIEVRNSRPLGSGLGRIRERLDREGGLTWVPPPGRDGSNRTLEVGSAPGATCDVRLAVSGLVPGSSRPRARDQPELVLGPGGDRLRGSVRSTDGDPIPVDAPVPPIDELGSSAGPAVALAAEVVRHANGDETTGERDSPGPVVPGSVLLGSRDAFAGALYGRPDYRAWARARVVRWRVDRLATAAGGTGAPEVAAYRDALRDSEWEPTPEELRGALAGWLGDVEIGRLVEDVDRALAERVLVDPIAPERLAAGWRRLRRWLRPLEDRAELGIAVPVRGGAADVVGFVRVVLPVDAVLHPARAGVAEAPYAAWFARALAGRIAPSPSSVLDARYHAVSRDDVRAIRRALLRAGRDGSIARHDLRAVEIEIDVGRGPERATAWFRAAKGEADGEVDVAPVAWAAGSSEGAVREALRDGAGPEGPVVVDRPDRTWAGGR